MKSISRVLFLTFSIFILGISATAQTDPKLSEDFKHNQEVYLNAMKFNDVAVAREALYHLISIAPDDLSLLDSLAFLYFDYRQFASAALVCKEMLSKLPKHPPALEMSAISFENLGLNEQALTNYESLYLIQNNIVTLYKITYLQYQLKRFTEFENNATSIIEDEQSLTMNLLFSGENNEQQQIPMRAAVYNFKGLIAQDGGDKVKAAEMFDEALKIAPEFYLAIISKEALNN